MRRIIMVFSGVIVPFSLMLAGCNVTITQTSSSAEDWVTVRDYEEDTVVRLTTGNEYILRYGERRDNTLRHPLVSSYDDIRETIPVQTGRPYGSFYSGTVETRYGRARIYRYEDHADPNLYIDLIDLDSDTMLETGGDRFVSIPSGRHEYTGTNVFGVWTNDTWGSGTSDGRFHMEVDFDAGTGRIVSGFSAEVLAPRGTNAGLDRSDMSGNFGVNSEKGTFSSNDIEVRNSRTRNTYIAEMNGSFHGNRAGGVTAIYVERHENPNFFGALAGVRTER